MKGSDFLQHKGQKTHHASAVTVVAHRHLGARLAATSVTPQAGVLDVHTQVFIGTHHCLQKRELHQKLKAVQSKEAEL